MKKEVNMINSFFFIIIGFFLLVKGADFLVDGSCNVAKKFHIPEIVIGLTIISIGTSLPELFVSITSSLEGHNDIAIGNIIGSLAANLLLVLGITTLLNPIDLKRETRYIEIPLSIFILFVFMIMCNTENTISKEEGIILLFFLVTFVIYTIIMAKKGEKFDKEPIFEKENITKKEIKEKKQNIFLDILKIIGGIIALKYGAEITVDHAQILAKVFYISEKLTGIIILALGTSLPELITCVSAAIKRKTDIAVGNILGSNILNILLIIGMSATIAPISFNITYNIDLVVIIISTVMLEMFAYIPPIKKMSQDNGFIYLMIYVTYIFNLIMLKA